MEYFALRMKDGVTVLSRSDMSIDNTPEFTGPKNGYCSFCAWGWRHSKSLHIYSLERSLEALERYIQEIDIVRH